MFLTRIRNSNYLLFTGLLMLVCGLPVSLFLTSLSQFFIAGSFFLEGNPREKFRRFLGNRAALLLCGIWLLHLIGLLWTSDLADGVKDLRIKLPLLILPFVLGGSEPLSEKQFRTVMAVFIGAVFAGSMASMGVLLGIVHPRAQLYDIRDIFIFGISHIRFALFTCIAIYTAIWFIAGRKHPIPVAGKAGLVLLCIWFVLFLVIIESVTGLSVLMVSGLMILIFIALTRVRLRTRIGLLAIVILVPLTLFFSIREFVKRSSVRHAYPILTDARTSQGNSYYFDTTSTQFENGYPVNAYINEGEMRTAWNSRSSHPFDSLDERKQPLRATLIRFLTSKGDRKDAESVGRLSEKEIRSVERGIANVDYQDLSSVRSRLLQITWEVKEFIRGGNPSGHSVTQRIEFWKAALGIIREHPLAGVGTGDLPAAYKAQYEKMNTKLSTNYRLRSHNQYLAIAVAFGIVGLAYFLFVCVYLFFSKKNYTHFLFASFWIIALLSMLTEDTLETQAGATFIGLFAALFLFSNSEMNNVEKAKPRS